MPDFDRDRLMNRIRELGRDLGERAGELSQRVRGEAERTWKQSNLRVEVGLLRRKRSRRLQELGELAYSLMKDEELDVPALRRIFEDVEDIDDAIEERERRIEDAPAELEIPEPPPEPERAAGRSGKKKAATRKTTRKKAATGAARKRTPRKTASRRSPRTDGGDGTEGDA